MRYFMDTAYVVALLNSSNALHEKAKSYFRIVETA